MARLENAYKPGPEQVYAQRCARALFISLSIFSVCWWLLCWCADHNYLALEQWAQTVRDEGIPGVLPWVTTALLVFPLAICAAAVLHCRSNWERTRWWVAGVVIATGLLAGSMLLQTWRGDGVIVSVTQGAPFRPVGPSLFPPGTGRYVTAALVLLSSLFFAVGYWHADRLWRRQRDNKCLKCGYDLRGSPGSRCPECGTRSIVSEPQRDGG